MIPLGFYSVCLRATQLHKTVDFYKRLGFQPTGEDAPGLRISLKHGNESLTFMSFLNDNLINFRGAHIHRLKEEFKNLGIRVKLFEELKREARLMLDEHGVPLPENECGFFSVYDPDGHDFFFNTNPEERAPFEEAVLASPYLSDQNQLAGEMLGRLVYCLVVTDLVGSLTFYKSLDLNVVEEGDCAWISPPQSHGNTRFVFQLKQDGKKDVVIRFYQNGIDRSRMVDLGFKRYPSEDGIWSCKDPDGRAIEVISKDWSTTPLGVPQ